MLYEMFEKAASECLKGKIKSFPYELVCAIWNLQLTLFESEDDEWTLTNG